MGLPEQLLYTADSDTTGPVREERVLAETRAENAARRRYKRMRVDILLGTEMENRKRDAENARAMTTRSIYAVSVYVTLLTDLFWHVGGDTEDSHSKPRRGSGKYISGSINQSSFSCRLGSETKIPPHTVAARSPRPEEKRKERAKTSGFGGTTSETGGRSDLGTFRAQTPSREGGSRQQGSW